MRILKEENIKATFLTCGAVAERFLEAVQAILDHGHVSKATATITRSRATCRAMRKIR